MGMLKEFREFAVKGSAVDMAVGIIIGGAFGKIVTSLVNNVIMPPIGLLLGNVPFSELFIPLKAVPKEQHLTTLRRCRRQRFRRSTTASSSTTSSIS